MGVDLVVSHARWLSPEGELVRGHVVVEDRKITLLREHEPFPLHAPRLEAGGDLLLPGAVDAHTHLRQPGEARKEGIRNGSRAALRGGVTTLLDMPNNRPPCSTTLRLARKRALFSTRCALNWGLHVLALPGRLPPPLPHASGKVYMARACAVRPVTEGEPIARLMQTWPRLTFHAEDERRFASQADLPHHVRRPREAIRAALATLEHAMERAPGCRVILCHVSTQDEVEWVRRQRARGFDVWAETCPHYCVFTQDDFLARGPILQVNPPLRTEADRQAVVEGLSDGSIDFLSSDHAPHTPQEKAGPHPPSGIAGIEWLWPVALSLVDAGRLTLARAQEALTRASECFGLPMPQVRDGAIADFVVATKARLAPPGVITRAGVPVYPDLPWHVRATVVGGRIRYREGTFVDLSPGTEVVS